jgi:DNA-binding MarR family transcriptional regulator
MLTMSSPFHKLSGNPMQIGLLLKLPYIATERYSSRRLHELGFTDIRPAHYVVFQVIAREGSRLTELADGAGMTKQSMGYLVDYLQEHGYLERVADPRDQRAQIIRVTAKSMRLDRSVEQIFEELHEDWARRVGKAKFKQLRKLLGELVMALDEPAAAGNGRAQRTEKRSR